MSAQKLSFIFNEWVKHTTNVLPDDFTIQTDINVSRRLLKKVSGRALKTACKLWNLEFEEV